MSPIHIEPSLEQIQELVNQDAGNTIPIYAQYDADLLTPVSAYLKIADKCEYAFLFESVTGGEHISRYSFIGTDPYKIIKVGSNEANQGDPLIPIQNELASIRYVPMPGLPTFTGGAVGYIGFDCFQYFEPSIQGDLNDPIGIPDGIFMLCDTIVVFDRVRQMVKVVSHFRSDAKEPDQVASVYNKAVQQIQHTIDRLELQSIPTVPQPPITLGREAESNVGAEGYKGFVTTLKHHIKEGDIFQAVPSQRLTRRTDLHPFNAYRHLRSLNPSPYMFYMTLGDFQIVGASPEMLTKVQDRIAYTHPIAGTRKRGKTPQEDQALAEDLLQDPKERAEHVMLVDLGRNDINRVCKPESVKVDKLMEIEYYSHVMHIVSNVSGELRDDKTSFDAFRAVFPAGTVSGAPKIKAVELIRGLEKEKRGVYAGSVGHFDYSGDMDTCIAIRTMLFKDGYAYLQAGGGIVYDSVEEDEYIETMNKMGSNLTAIAECEQKIYDQQQHEAAQKESSALDGKQ